MVVVAGAGVALAGTIGSGIIASQGAKSAARIQARAADAATQAQLEQYYQTREDLAPYREAGYTALSTLTRDTEPGVGRFVRRFGMEDFQTDPGYQFRLAEGQKTLERSAAARGNLLSSRTLKDLSRYSQEYASGEYGRAFDRYQTEYGNAFNRLAAIAGIGQAATTTTGAVGQQTAQQVGQNVIGAGNARAAGTIGSANALGGTLQNLGNIGVQYATLAALQQNNPYFSPYGPTATPTQAYSTIDAYRARYPQYTVPN